METFADNFSSLYAQATHILSTFPSTNYALFHDTREAWEHSVFLDAQQHSLPQSMPEVCPYILWPPHSAPAS